MRIFLGGPDIALCSGCFVLYIIGFVNRDFNNNLFSFFPLAPCRYLLVITNDFFFVPSPRRPACRIAVDADEQIGPRLVGEICAVPVPFVLVGLIAGDDIGGAGIKYLNAGDFLFNKLSQLFC